MPDVAGCGRPKAVLFRDVRLLRDDAAMFKADDGTLTPHTEMWTVAGIRVNV